MKRIVLTLALFAAVLPAHAQRVSKIDGNRLMGLCTGKEPKLCEAYVSGVADAIAEEGPARRACLPTTVVTQQMVDVVVKYLRNTPEQRDRSGAYLSYHALEKAWPCH